MKKHFNQDTIAAISTPLGEGGIGIVRLSGTKSLSIVDKLFRGKDSLPPSKLPTYTLHYGHVIHKNEVLDEVILSIMRAPKSYTKEDVVEINCHGGILPLQRVLEAVLEKGARLATPGEFTKRAFLKGRIDLSQAEAVLDIIQAKTDLALKSALEQLEGKFSQEIRKLKEQLEQLLISVEAGLDFPEEEDVIIIERKKIIDRVEAIKKNIQALLETFLKGKILREGLLVAIVGRANVGKSTLFNTLAGKERAIVTDIPGTTRDLVEEWINLEGIPVRLVDMAGFKKARNIIDQKGQEKAAEIVEKAELVIFMVDGSEKLNSQDKKIVAQIKDKNLILVINKSDLERRISFSNLKHLLPGKEIIQISALQEKGIEVLLNAIHATITEGKIPFLEGALMANARHKEVLKEALQAMERTQGIANGGFSDELIAFDLREVRGQIQSILGESVDNDILDRIFEKFCIGK